MFLAFLQVEGKINGKTPLPLCNYCNIFFALLFTDFQKLLAFFYLFKRTFFPLRQVV